MKLSALRADGALVWIFPYCDFTPAAVALDILPGLA